MSKKKVITIFSLLIIGILTVSAISYSIAGLGNGDETLLGAGDTPQASSGYVSAIDLIVENSKKAENNTLNIVEIVPSGTAGSDLKKYIDEGLFKQYVIDANSTVGAMADNTIRHDLVPIDGNTTLDSTQGSNILGTTSSKISEILNSADLIYLSCPYYTAYVDKMSEEIYDYLHTFASGRNKPLIMDFVKSTDTEGSLANKTYGALISEIQLNYIRYKTFPWGDGYTAEQFFKNVNDGKGKSHYLPFTSGTRTYKALVISDTANSTIEKGLKEDYKNNQSVRTSAYYGTGRPADELTVDVVASNAITVAQLEGTYDFIAIESNVKSKQVASDVYTKLKTMSETGRYIFYGTDKAIDSTSDTVYSASNNYIKLMSLLMTANGLSRQANVLSVRYGFFTSLYNAGADGKDTAKQIADLFNNSDYRGSSTSGGSKKYRVLEIEPCYPIDLELAESQSALGANYKDKIRGMYYTIPDQVMKGVTKDEIQDGTEYYAFSISKAKIAKALNKPYNEIEVEQMSVNELISSKEVLSETYDLIYIGGDCSAYVPTDILNLTQSTNYASNQNHNELQKLFTSFDMYTHTGILMPMQLYGGGTPFGTVASGDTSAVYSGHDLNSIKYGELEKYVDAKLPIMIDKKVTDAYDAMKGKTRLEKLEQTNIDPDSYMYKFLAYADEARTKKGASNIGWGTIEALKTNTNNPTQIIKNENSQYGNTLIQVPEGQADAGAQGVTVFNDTYNTALADLEKSSSKRPFVSITEAPSQYDQNDPSTVHSETTFSVSASATGGGASSYDFYLLVDQNGDGIFEDNEGTVDPESECKAKASGSSVTLSYGLEDDFFGLISWKVVARSSDNPDLCDAKTGAAFFKIDDEAQKLCRVLQVMPINDSTTDYNWNMGHTLYFCTECQQSLKRLQYNVTVNGANNDANPGLNSATDTSTVNGVYVGLHEHEFGIVKYDSAISNDDWEDNFADVLTHGADGTMETGDFAFDLDIVSPSEFDTLCANAVGRTETVINSNKASAKQLDASYKAQLASPALQTAEETLATELYEIADLIKTRNITGKGRAAVIVKNIGTATDPGPWMVDKDYYKFWEYCNSGADDPLYNGISGSLGDLKTAYSAYITEYDKAVKLKNQSKTYSQAAGDESNWIENNYDIVVLGFADNFGGADISEVSAAQLKTYVKAGGSVLNTHDTMARNAQKGAVNLTAALLDAFGMDRFHVTGISDGSEESFDANAPGITATLSMGQYSEVAPTKQEVTIQNSYAWSNNLNESTVPAIPLYDKDVTVYCSWDSSSNKYKYDHYEESATVSSNNKVSLKFVDMSNNNTIAVNCNMNVNGNYSGGCSNGTFTTDKKSSQVVYPAKSVKVKLEGSNYLIKANKDTTGITATTQKLSAEQSLPADNLEDSYVIRIQAFKPDGTTSFPLPANDVTLTIKGTTYNCSYENDATLGYHYKFTIPKTALVDDPSVPVVHGTFRDAITQALASDTKYNKYVSETHQRFFTERIKAAKVSDYQTTINNSWAKGYVHYNSPIGVTDFFVSADSSSNPTSPYRYAYSSGESYDHAVNTDGWNMEAKYGTRRASKVNQGGITTYPFAVSDELLISATHAQYFTLDLDDPNVNVWYTLGANFVDGGNPDAGFARYDSSFFAASPHDGMNNYFLYSKNNVFYTGAGHMVVTGRNKDNNDERKLFINVIVNSVNKGISKPKIKLYNICPNNDGNCEHEYVNPNDVTANKKLSTQTNKVYYNKSAKMYQYNVDEGQEHIFPTFDFRAIAGSADLSEIQVFWDLDYGTGPGLIISDDYVEDAGTNHVMIFSYSGIDATNLNNVRMKLRDTMTNLEMLERYMKNYHSYSYIVIHVKDQNDKIQVARIKINIVPHLFDLTDAGFDYQNTGLATDRPVMDITDRRKFNI